MATSRGLRPSSVVALTSAPASNSNLAISSAPLLAENIKGVNLPEELALTSAPAPINKSTTPVCPSAAAHINALWPLFVSNELGSAPAARSFSTAPNNPVLEQLISTVSPLGSTAKAFASARNNVSTIASLPFRQAIAMGVIPNSFAASTAAPSLKRRSAKSVAPQ